MIILFLPVLFSISVWADEGAEGEGAETLCKDGQCYTVDRSRPEWIGEATSVPNMPDEETSLMPTKFNLDQNYPNPFNPETTIRFDVKDPCRVVLTVYNILGREVDTLIDKDYEPGFHHIDFNASRFSTGVYFYRIQMKDFFAVKKMVVLE